MAMKLGTYRAVHFISREPNAQVHSISSLNVGIPRPRRSPAMRVFSGVGRILSRSAPGADLVRRLSLAVIGKAEASACCGTGSAESFNFSLRWISSRSEEHTSELQSLLDLVCRL